MTFHGLAIWMNYNGPSGVERAFKRVIPKLKQHVHGGVWPDIQRPLQKAQQELLHATRDMDQITVESRYKSQGLVVLHGSQS